MCNRKGILSPGKRYISNMEPLIFDIRRYSINDGPGIRITIFLKGCPLSCKWCHNPESQSPEVQKLYTASKCIGAKECIEVCPTNALSMTSEGIVTDISACDLCGKCAEVCPSKAIEMSGQFYSKEELFGIIERERIHMDQSGGGVTFSGGEPMMYPEFLTEILDICGDKGIHRAVDTCGYADTQKLLDVAKRTDLFLYDLKLMDPEEHRKWTGVSNKLILKNLRVLSENNSKINIRIPLIRNVNTDPAGITKMAEFIISLSGEKPSISLLPFHNIASGKYKKLEIEYNQGEMREPSKEDITRSVEIFNSFGLDVETGG